MMNKKEMLKAVQKLNFAAYDLLLYLDTHPCDRKAFKLFTELVEKLKKAIEEYEKMYGPLEAYNTAAQDTFNWLKEPWPWEKQGRNGVKKED